MKYSQEFKIECVKKYKNGECIEDPPGVIHDSFRRQVRKWVHIYNSIGEIGLSHNRPPLSIENRLELFNRVDNGESYNSVAGSVGIQDSLLSKWHRIYLEKGIDGLKSLKRGRKSMNKKPINNKTDSEKSKKELLEELELLRAENEYLKKLDALVQKRENRQPKKK